VHIFIWLFNVKNFIIPKNWLLTKISLFFIQKVLILQINSYQMHTELAKFIEEVQKRMETWSDVLQQVAPLANCDSQQQIADMLKEINQIFKKFINSNLFASIRQRCNNAEWLRGLGMYFEVTGYRQ
jgi:hypothetical protein